MTGRPTGLCVVDGCHRIIVRKHMCRAHAYGPIAYAPPPPDAAEIPGHPGYFVTPDGTAYTTWSGRGRRDALELKRQPDKGGYPTVRLRGKRWALHRLVMLTFVGPCPDGLETRHLNGIRWDARLSNLKYGTAKENAEDRARHGSDLIGENSPHTRWSDAEVAEAVASYLAGRENQRQIGERMGTSQAVVSRWIQARDLPTRTPPQHATATSHRDPVPLRECIDEVRRQLNERKG